MNCIIVCDKPWTKQLASAFNNYHSANIFVISKKELFSYDYLNKVSPDYIFFPHYSYQIPEMIYKNFECVVFHMTDLPFGRGGSPLQNLIEKGIYKTKMSAIKVTGEIDAGPIYLKRNFYLYGSAEEIYLRSSQLIYDMIVDIVKNKQKPYPQTGEVTIFKRRKPSDSDIKFLSTLEQVYDYIRMLDADGYPLAYLETDKFRFEFSRASQKCDYIIADVKIFKKAE